MEIQHAGLDVQTGINAHLRRLAQDAGLPLVATCDAHYPCREDADSHEALLAIQTRDVLSNPKRFRFDTKEFYLKTAAEMAEALPDFLDALPVTMEIAERCAALELPLGDIKLPRFPVPGDEPAEVYLERLCREGMAAPLPGRAAARAPRSACASSWASSREMGFASYFLIVWDYMRWARENGVGVGPGRGSAAGSLVAYTLRIVNLDPLAHDLLFERFLNPGRKSMPDIDTDFSVAGRDRVVQYVTQKYGSAAVARIGTFGKLLARAVVRDSGRVLGHSYGQVDRIAKLVPERPIGIKLADAMKPGTELAQAYGDDPVTKQILDTARPLEGLVRNEGVHAAGVVIAPSDITDYVPGAPGRRGQRGHAGPRPRRRGAGPAEDGLPRPAQPGRHPGRSPADRGPQRRGPRHRVGAARRPAHLRDAGPRRRDRRLPVRVERHARGPARGAARPSSPT